MASPQRSHRSLGLASAVNLPLPAPRRTLVGAVPGPCGEAADALPRGPASRGALQGGWRRPHGFWLVARGLGCAFLCLSVYLLVGPSEALGLPGKLGGEYGEVVVFEDARVAYDAWYGFYT